MLRRSPGKKARYPVVLKNEIAGYLAPSPADLLRLLCRHSSVIQESRRIPGARLYMRIAAHCGQIQQKCGAQFYILPVPADAFFSFISFHVAHPKIIFPHLRFQPDAAAVIHGLVRRHDHSILTGNAPVSERRIRFVLIQNIHTDFPRPQLLAKHGICVSSYVRNIGWFRLSRWSAASATQ